MNWPPPWPCACCCPWALALPVLALLIWFAVGKGLSPLRRIGSEVAQRDPANLAPLEERTAPRRNCPLAACAQ